MTPVPEKNCLDQVSRSAGVTAVLNAYGRPDAFECQLESVRKQTIAPEEVLVWDQSPPQYRFHDHWFDKTVRAKSSRNLGVWARFAFALNARTEFVCLFDDDTIPGSQWFANCIETIKHFDGLLGTAGVTFRRPDAYRPFLRTGWANPNSETTRVDIVGNAWFFRRDWLGIYWSEIPDITSSTIAGEDIHFSYALQKHGISTFVPPHRVDQPEKWGSNPQLAQRYGCSGPAIHTQAFGRRAMDLELRKKRKLGFRLLCE